MLRVCVCVCVSQVLDGTKLLVLTSDIPALVSWPAVGCETVLAQRTAASFKTVLDTATAARTGTCVCVCVCVYMRVCVCRGVEVHVRARY